MNTQTTPAAPAPTPGWREGLTKVAILYRMAECGQEFELVNLSAFAGFLDPILEEMSLKDGLIDLDASGLKWKTTAKGRELLKKMVTMTDLAMRFEIFGAVRLDIELSDEEADPDQPGQTYPWVYDPRFLAPDAPESELDQAEDLRLAMFVFMNEHLREELNGGRIDPYQIVFLQKLGADELKSDTDIFWAQLQHGDTFGQIEEIVQSAYQWQDMCPEDLMIAQEYMVGLYTAGMAEAQRRGGDECQQCGTPLLLCDNLARQNNDELTECPGCGAPLIIPEQVEEVLGAEYECPKCRAGIEPGQSHCPGCGAEVDFSLPEGSVETVTETVVEEEIYDDFWAYGGYDYGWGYDPYPYYDPYDPFVDALAFACLATVLW